MNEKDILTDKILSDLRRYLDAHLMDDQDAWLIRETLHKGMAEYAKLTGDVENAPRG